MGRVVSSGSSGEPQQVGQQVRGKRRRPGGEQFTHDNPQAIYRSGCRLPPAALTELLSNSRSFGLVSGCLEAGCGRLAVVA